MTETAEQRIRLFIEENFIFADNMAAFPAEKSLIEAGVIDSTGVLEMVGFLEQEFGIKVQDADIVPQNLDSIAAIASFVQSRQAA